MGEPFSPDVPSRVPFGGLDSPDPLSFKVYDADRIMLGKRMEDHLRIAVCYWHSFAWPGSDMFGSGTLDRPWIGAAGDPMQVARAKMAAAFEFFGKLGVPYYCFHDRDVAPDGASFAEFRANLDALADDALGYQERTGVRLLWGTANLFSHPQLVVFDQPTQAFYSPFQGAEPPPLQDADRAAVDRIFRLLRKVAADLSPSLQIIVMDHETQIVPACLASLPRSGGMAAS